MGGLADKFFGSQFSTIATSIGYSAAVLICEEFGGQEKIYIPKNPEAEHAFRNIVGDEKFSKMASVFGGSQIDIPQPPKSSPKKSAIIDDLIRNKEKNALIAHRHRVCERYVRRIRSELVEAGILDRRTGVKPGYMK